MGDVPRWEERGLRAPHACSSEQPPPGKLSRQSYTQEMLGRQWEEEKGQEGLRE